MNLRYFYESPRYSEDIDLDLKGVPPWSLEKKVDGVLGSCAMKLILRAGGMTITEFSKPKQTETTRPRKVALDVSGHSEAVRSKIEFSNRSGQALCPGVRAPTHREPPMRCGHLPSSTTRKMCRLSRVQGPCERSETQALDVFDLDPLLRRRPLPDGSLDSATCASGRSSSAVAVRRISRSGSPIRSKPDAVEALRLRGLLEADAALSRNAEATHETNRCLWLLATYRSPSRDDSRGGCPSGRLTGECGPASSSSRGGRLVRRLRRGLWALRPSALIRSPLPPSSPPHFRPISRSARLSRVTA